MLSKKSLCLQTRTIKCTVWTVDQGVDFCSVGQVILIDISELCTFGKKMKSNLQTKYLLRISSNRTIFDIKRKLCY